jgi:hypothetical protein
VSAAVVAVLWLGVSGAMAFVVYRTRVGRALALCVSVFLGACGYIGFRLGCGLHL